MEPINDMQNRFQIVTEESKPDFNHSLTLTAASDDSSTASSNLDLSFITAKWESNILGVGYGVKSLAELFESIALSKEETSPSQGMGRGLAEVVSDAFRLMRYHNITPLTKLKESDYEFAISVPVRCQLRMAGVALESRLSKRSSVLYKILKDKHEPNNTLLPSVAGILQDLVNAGDPRLKLDLLRNPLVRRKDESFRDFVNRLWDKYQRTIRPDEWHLHYYSTVFFAVIRGLEANYPMSFGIIKNCLLYDPPRSFDSIQAVVNWCEKNSIVATEQASNAPYPFKDNYAGLLSESPSTINSNSKTNSKKRNQNQDQSGSPESNKGLQAPSKKRKRNQNQPQAPSKKQNQRQSAPASTKTPQAPSKKQNQKQSAPASTKGPQAPSKKRRYRGCKKNKQPSSA